MNEPILVRDQLLTTKFFIPSPSHAMIPRSRLTTQLSVGLRRKLTLVSAPAGFGKTTLLASWVLSLPTGHPHVAWVSLDEEDNEAPRFWKYVLTALNSCQPGLCSHLLAFYQLGQLPSVQYLVRALINSLAGQKEHFLLVLDDYHVITELAVHTSLTFLLDHLPPQLHLVLATRVAPPSSALPPASA